MISKSCKNFVGWQSVAGMLTILALALAALAGVAGLSSWRELAREPLLGVSFGSVSLGKPLVFWANQIFMTVILFVTGLECKRAFVEEELAGADRLRLPLLGALGGMLASGAVHAALAGGQPGAGASWVMASGMDMTLGLAALALLGERVPGALKAFFASMAMFSMLGSAALAAAVQPELPSWTALAGAGLCLAVLACLNLGRVESVSAYLLIGALLWVALARTDAWAVLAGPLSAFFIPARDREQGRSPLLILEQDLLPTVCCIVIPALVLVNAGLFPQEGGGTMATRQAAVMLPGLFPAKAAGIFGICWAGARLGLCALPAGVDWKEFAGVVLLTGAGFTVNVFLGLAISGQDAAGWVLLAALAASALSLASGLAMLRYAFARRRNKVVQRS